MPQFYDDGFISPAAIIDSGLDGATLPPHPPAPPISGQGQTGFDPGFTDSEPPVGTDTQTMPEEFPFDYLGPGRDLLHTGEPPVPQRLPYENPRFDRNAAIAREEEYEAAGRSQSNYSDTSAAPNWESARARSEYQRWLLEQDGGPSIFRPSPEKVRNPNQGAWPRTIPEPGDPRAGTGLRFEDALGAAKMLAPVPTPENYESFKKAKSSGDLLGAIGSAFEGGASVFGFANKMPKFKAKIMKDGTPVVVDERTGEVLVKPGSFKEAKAQAERFNSNTAKDAYTENGPKQQEHVENIAEDTRAARIARLAARLDEVADETRPPTVAEELGNSYAQGSRTAPASRNSDVVAAQGERFGGSQLTMGDFTGEGNNFGRGGRTIEFDPRYSPEMNDPSNLVSLSKSLPPSQQRGQGGLFDDFSEMGQPVGKREERGTSNFQLRRSLPLDEQRNQELSGLVPEGQKGAVPRLGTSDFELSQSLPLEQQRIQGTSGLIPEGQRGAVPRPGTATFEPSSSLTGGELAAQESFTESTARFDSFMVGGVKRFNSLPINDQLQVVAEILGVPRTVMASGDISAGGRQAFSFILSHPVEFTKAFTNQIKAIGQSTEEYTRIQDRLFQRTLENARGQVDLMPSLARGKTLRYGGEEAFASSLVDQIPVLGKVLGPISSKSEQAYNTMLNSIRAGVYNNMVESFAHSGKPLADDQLRDLSRTIDHFSGRGFRTPDSELGRSVQQLANSVFFAPQYQVSRVRMVADTLSGAKELVRALHEERLPDPVAVEKVRLGLGYIGGVTGILAMASASGLKVEYRPNAALFGKIDLGEPGLGPGTATAIAEEFGFTTQVINGRVYMDVTQAMAGDIRIVSQVLGTAFGQKAISASGQPRDLANPEGPFDQSVGGAVTSFVQGKLNPPAGIVSGLTIGEGKSPGGDEITLDPSKIAQNPIGALLNDPLLSWIIPLSISGTLQASDKKYSEFKPHRGRGRGID